MRLNLNEPKKPKALDKKLLKLLKTQLQFIKEDKKFLMALKAIFFQKENWHMENDMLRT